MALAKEFQPDYIYWNVMHPMKGTDAHYYFMERGSKIDDDTDYTSLSDLTWETNEPLVDTPEFSKWERKKARYYAVVETDQYIPYPHLLDQFSARAREYELVDTAAASLTRMRVKHPQIAPQINSAISALESSEVATADVADDPAAIPALKRPDAARQPDAALSRPGNGSTVREPVGRWLRTRLFNEPRTSPELLDRFLQMYPQVPALAFWRALEAERLSTVEFPEPIVDLGCGDGTFTDVALGGRQIAWGLDIESLNFPKARALGIYGRLEVYDGGRLPLDDGSVGSILANSVLEHVENLDELLRECRRVLRPGGRLVLTVPTREYDELLYFAQLARADGDAAGAEGHVQYHRHSSHHVNWWSADGWAEQLATAGFEVAGTHEYVGQTSAWMFDILKTLGDQGVWIEEPSDGADGFKARFDRLLLERTLDEVVAEDQATGGPFAAVVLEALAGVPAEPAPPTREVTDEPGVASIFANAQPFYKDAPSDEAYAETHARLTRDGLEHVRCYMCGADDPRPVGTKEGLQIVTCGRCEFFYVNPRIPIDKLPELYDRTYWYERMQLHGYPDVQTRAGHDYRLAVERWKAIAEKVPAGSYLDIGCSNGAMVKRADELGYEAHGIELDREIAALARTATGRPVFEGPVGEHRFARGEFNVITMHDVFEHLYDPRVELQEIKRVLAPEGLLVVETFRRDCPQFEAVLGDMSHDDIKPGEHIYMYRQAEITSLLADAGLAVEAVGYPDGDANSRLLLHVRHAPVKAAAPPRRKGGRPQRQRKGRKSRRTQATAVSVIMPTHNRADVLATTLRAYSEQTVPPSEIIVIDDGSTDHTAEVVAGIESVPIVYHRQDAAGPGAARNWALSRAHGDLVLITGDDIVPDARLIERHIAAHHARPDKSVAVVGGIEWSDAQRVTYFMDYITGAGGQQFNLKELEDLDRENLPAGWFLTSNISLKRQWLEATGEHFDERFTGAAYEDIEFGMRLQERHRLRIAYADDALGFHLHPQDYESFSQRQVRAGRAAATLLGLRPELKAHFIKGDASAELERALADLPIHEQAIAGFEGRLAAGEALSDVDRALLNGHYAAALQTQHTRGLVEALEGGPSTSVAVISLNQRDRVAACLDGVRAHTDMPHQLLVVDAGSGDSEPMDAGEDVKVIHAPAQRSRAWAINAAFEATQGDVVVLDASADVTDGWLRSLREATEISPEVGLVGPVTNYGSGPQLDSETREGAVDAVSLGAFCLLARRDVIDRTGGFDVQFVDDGAFAELDFALSTRRAGFRAVVARAAFVSWPGERRGAGAGNKHDQSVEEAWARLCRKWRVEPGTTPGDPKVIEELASMAEPETTAAVEFVAAPDWGNPGSLWRELVRAYATGYGPRDGVELTLLLDPARGVSVDEAVQQLQTLIAELGVDPNNAPGLDLVDDFAWTDGAPEPFQKADAFVRTEPELAQMRGDYIKSAENAGLPVIRKADFSERSEGAAKDAGLLVIEDPSWESLEAARLMVCERAARVPLATY